MRYQSFLNLLVWGSLFLSVSCQTGSETRQDKLQEIVDTKLGFAQKQIDAGKPEHALQVLRPLLREFPKDAKVHNMAGIAFLALAKPIRAQSFFKAAYKLEKSPSYALNLSSALLAAGSFSSAHKLLKALLDGSYEYKERIYHNMALVMENEGKTDEAIHLYSTALDENPSYFLSNIRLGKLYDQTKRPRLALSAFQQASKTCVVCFEPVHEIVMLYLKAKAPEKAKKVLLDFVANKEVAKEDRESAQKLLKLASR
ncbi:MAG: tetratricopeptide repeat protein [Deltaproteobacteria bacterium]|nr:tetratricopeptide repeat protein [Deltaproteobacteria bacterium]